MADKFSLNAVVSYRDVDRSGYLSLPGVFKFLQEAAILHANEYDTGTRAMTTRGETWVLNRLAAAMYRYPRYEETLRIETWSRGVKGFKGHREFRVVGVEGAPLFSASSLWLYVSLKTQSIVRVPADVAAGFPSCREGPFCPELEELAFPWPAAGGLAPVTISVRYSDVDGNGHVNNTVYADYVQTALGEAGLAVRPVDMRIKYARAIPLGTEKVTVRLAPAGGRVVFEIGSGETLFAQGDLGLPM